MATMATPSCSAVLMVSSSSRTIVISGFDGRQCISLRIAADDMKVVIVLHAKALELALIDFAKSCCCMVCVYYLAVIGLF